MKGYVDVYDAAKRIGTSAANLRHLIRVKKVSARKKGITKNSPWYVPLSEVERLKQAYQVGVANV